MELKNAVLLLDLGHTQRGEHAWRMEKGKEIKT
jgi:hypothetical protein